MRQPNKLLSSFVALFLLASAAGAPVLRGQEGGVFRSETRLVLLYVSVADKAGNLIADLPQSAFTIYENNKPQQIRIFRREDVPVSLGLVVDNSGSMRDKRQKVESAVLSLVKSSQRQDEVFVVNFNEDAWLDAEFTSNTKELEEALARLDARGGTALRDGLSMSIDYMLEKAKKPKKVLLAVTDGEDTASTSINLERLVDKARQSEILVYTIGVLGEEDRRAAKRAKRAMDELAESSGGLAYYPKTLEEVGRIAQLIGQEIRNQYIIAYTPDVQELDGSYRRIQVKVKGAGSPVVRTRSGYFARPDKPETAPTQVMPGSEGKPSSTLQ